MSLTGSEQNYVLFTPKKKVEHLPHLQKRSLSISGHATSIALEKEFWLVLEAAAQRQDIPLSKFISEIDSYQRKGRPLTSTLRLRALEEAFLSTDTQTVFREISL